MILTEKIRKEFGFIPEIRDSEHNDMPLFGELMAMRQDLIIRKTWTDNDERAFQEIAKSDPKLLAFFSRNVDIGVLSQFKN